MSNVDFGAKRATGESLNRRSQFSQIRPEQQATPTMEEKAGENESTCSSQEAGDGNRALEDDCNRSPDFLSSISCHINKFSRASFEVGEIVKFVHSKLR